MNAALDAPTAALLVEQMAADILLGKTITADRWRAAYGAAADYQTVLDGRAYLASVTP